MKLKGQEIEGMRGWGDERLRGWEVEGMRGWGDERLRGWEVERLRGWEVEGMRGWGDERLRGWEGNNELRGNNKLRHSNDVDNSEVEGLIMKLRGQWVEGAASFQSSGECQTVARVTFGTVIAALLTSILCVSTCANPEILGNNVLPKEVFWEELAASSGLTSCLANVWHS